MSRSADLRRLLMALAFIGCSVSATPAQSPPQQLGLGRAATAAEIGAWSIAVRPDGQGLPPGKVGRGRVFAQLIDFAKLDPAAAMLGRGFHGRRAGTLGGPQYGACDI